MTGSTGSAGDDRGRLRVLVIQALVFSLFATLFVRLYYLQVVSGDQYHARAASQSLRDIVVQPQRGLIVDDEGRPLVANRTSWVVASTAAPAGKLADPEQRSAAAPRVPGARHGACRGSTGCSRRAATPRPSGGDCWNGSPYQPVPVAADVGKPMALRVLEQPEDYPGVIAEQQSVRSYPRAVRHQPAHVLGYLSPITSEEYDEAKEAGDTSVNGASVVGRAGVEQEYDRWLRGMPGYRTVAVDSMGRVLGDDGEVAGQPGDTLVTSIDAQGAGRRRAAAGGDDQDRAGDLRRGDRPELRRRLRRRVVMEAKTGRVVAMASQPTYDPSVWVGGISKKQLSAALLREGRRPAARPGDPGSVRARARRGSRSRP